jgi:hypothetical protein
MFRVSADNTDNAVSLDNLTLVANGLYAGAYFHKSPPGINDTILPDHGSSL